MRPSTRRRILVAAGILALVPVLLYAFRWPLLEGTLRRRLAEAVQKEIGAEIEIGRLDGSLLWSLRAEDVTLRFAEGILRKITLAQVRLHYGFLGKAPLNGHLKDARLVFDPSAATDTPLHESIRDLTVLARTLDWDGTLVLSSLSAILPDGRALALDEVRLGGRALKARGRMEGWGNLEAELRSGPAGELRISASSTEGPLRSLSFEVDGGPGPVHACRGKGGTSNRSLSWKGSWSGDAKGGLERIEGLLETDEGSLTTLLDLRSGRASVEADASIRLKDELQGTFRLQGRAEGPLAGPLELWTLSEIRVQSQDARFRGLTLGRIEGKIPGGRLPELPFSVEAIREADRASAEGTFRWDGDLSGTARLRLQAASLAPYRGLAGLPEDLELADVTADGTLTLAKGVYRLAGRAGAVRGNWGNLAASGMEARIDAGPTRVQLTEGRIRDLAGLSGIELQGTMDLEARSFQGDLSLGPDRFRLEGAFDPKGVLEAKVDFSGPLDLLKRWDLAIPPAMKPVRAAGTLKLADGVYSARSRIRWGDGADEELSLELEGSPGRWLLGLQPGAIRIPGYPRLQHQGLAISALGTRWEIRDCRLLLEEPQIRLRFGGDLASGAGPRELRLDIRELDVAGIPLGKGLLKILADPGTDAVTLEFSLGSPEGERLWVHGRVLPDPDLDVSLILPSLDGPLLRRMTGEIPVRGSITFGGRISGLRGDPRLNGTVRLAELSLEGHEPFELYIPLYADGRLLRVDPVARKTPYGTLHLDGRLNLQDRSLEAEAVLVTTDFGFLRALFPEQHHALLPAGTLRTRARVSGLLSAPETDLRTSLHVPDHALPAPLGRLRDLTGTVRFEHGKVHLDPLEGTLGEGRFRALGTWSIREPGRPFELYLEGRDLLLIERPMSRLRIDPSVHLRSLPDGTFRLTGTVEVPLCLVHEDLVSAARSAGSKVEELNAPRVRLSPAEGGGFLLPGLPGLQALHLDLGFTTPGEIRVENSLVGVILSGSGRVRGTGDAPTVSGTFNVLRGEVKLATGLFVQIQTAVAELPAESGRPATIRFRGRVGKGRGAIGIILDGALDRPNLLLESDPARSQKELLAALAFGRAPGEMSGTGALGSLAIKLVEKTFDDWPTADRHPGFFSNVSEHFKLNLAIEDEASRRAPWELPPGGSARGTLLRSEYLINSWLSVTAESDRGANVSGDLKLRLKFR